MKKRCCLFFTVSAILASVTFHAKAQINPGKSFLFSNSLATDSVMLMASWWNSKVKTVTYEAWIKPEESGLSFDGHRTRAVIYKQHYGTSGIYLGNNADGTSIVKVVVPGTSAQWSVTSLPRIKDKEWNYVALVLDGSVNKATVWLNEHKVDSIFTAPFTEMNFWAGHMPGGDGNLALVRPVTMGVQWPYYPGRTASMPIGRNSVDRFFRGEMDEVRIWEVARTDEQIISNLYQPLSGNEDGLLAYYNFDVISDSGDTLTNVKTGEKDCLVWGNNERSGLSKSLAMIRPAIVQPINQTVEGFDVEWNSLAGIEACYLDVATDSLFKELLNDYKNLKIEGDQTSFPVKVANTGSYYVRLRFGDKAENSFSIYSSVASVSIDNAEVTSIIVSSEGDITSISEDMGNLKLTARVVASGLTNNGVNWTVDDPKMAKVDQNGLLKANANGTLRVTATSVFTPSVSGSILIDITNQAPDIWTIPSVKRPAPIYWGGYRNMEQLVAPDAEWDFVKNHMDGFLFHGAYWTSLHLFPEVPEVATRLAAILNPLKKKNAIELGWPGTYLQFEPTVDMAAKKAEGHIVHLERLQSYGLTMDEIYVDWHTYQWKPLCLKHPDWTVKDIVAWTTGDFENYDGPATIYKPGYWPDYINTIHKSFPGVPVYNTNSPVWFWWDDFSSLGKSEHRTRLDPLTGYNPITGENSNIPVLVDGQPVTFNFNKREIIEGIINSSGKIGYAGMASDFPYNYTQWSDPVVRDSNNKKILHYEKWLQERGKKHTLIVNTGDGNSLFPNDPDLWDKDYYEKSMKYISDYQIRGGRADSYKFESWYSGPHTVVPETKQYSFTNLVKDAINYLKGIDQKLDLQIRHDSDPVYSGINLFQGRPDGIQNLVVEKNTSTQIFWIKLQNAGDVACYPMIKALKMNYEDWNISFFDQETNITSKIFSDEGYTFANLFDPGETTGIKIVIESSALTTGNLGLSIWAFWNPQDPANTVRDVVSISYDVSTGTTNAALNDDYVLTVYPNPVSGILYLDLNSAPKNFTARIIGLTGNIVYQREFDGISSARIDTRELNLRGLYVIEVIAEEKKYTKKLIIR